MDGQIKAATKKFEWPMGKKKEESPEVEKQKRKF